MCICRPIARRLGCRLLVLLVNLPGLTHPNLAGLVLIMNVPYCTVLNVWLSGGCRRRVGRCSAGYYCNTTSVTPSQHACPLGHYCGEGTGVPTPCPAGSYSNTTNNDAQDDCVNCTGGSYCQGTENTAATTTATTTTTATATTITITIVIQHRQIVLPGYGKHRNNNSKDNNSHDNSNGNNNSNNNSHTTPADHTAMVRRTQHHQQQ